MADLYTFNLQNTNNGEFLTYRLGKHHSESLNHLLARLVALIFLQNKNLTSAGEICEGDIPAFWQKENNDIAYWVEIGLPSIKKITKALNQTRGRVIIFLENPNQEQLTNYKNSFENFLNNRIRFYTLNKNDFDILIPQLLKTNNWNFEYNADFLKINNSIIQIKQMHKKENTLLKSNQTVARIAPTPSGYLHMGNAFNFIYTNHLIQKAGGKLILRIDDLDKNRTRNEYIDDIFETLNWLGINYKEGPQNTADFWSHYSQAKRTKQYETLALNLYKKGLAYACTCSRTEVRKENPSGLYTGRCRDKNIPFELGKTALRLKTESFTKPLYDFIIWRKDNIPAYHLVSLMDDVNMGVNLIVRGKDLIDSTEAQKILAEKAGLSSFLKAEFIHHDILRGESGEKLSKSDGAHSLKAMRESGMTANEVYNKAEKFFGIVFS